MLKNSSTGYGWMAIVLHWSMALFILALFFLGLYMTSLTYYDPPYRVTFFWHESLGMLVLLLLIFRYLWRIMNVLPEYETSLPVWQENSARLAHWLFYILIAVVCVSGYLISTAEGQPVNIWNLINVPAVSSFEAGFANTVGIIHWYAAIILMALTVVHTLAALFHHIVLKDNVLISIIKGVNHEK